MWNTESKNVSTNLAARNPVDFNLLSTDSPKTIFIRPLTVPYDVSFDKSKARRKIVKRVQ